MSVLRVYDPAQCDAEGVPLDWECCQSCGGRGVEYGGIGMVNPAIGVGYVMDTEQPCRVCVGHGSLRAAALHTRATVDADPRTSMILDFLATNQQLLVSCEDCQHPMSEGTWGSGRRPAPTELFAQRALVDALRFLKGGNEPRRPGFWSVCGEACAHGGHLREAGRPNSEMVDGEGDLFEVPEASWRHVDVRTLGWAADLRPEKLAVLCLRCWAAR